MSNAPDDKPAMSPQSAEAQPVKVGIVPLFSTWLYTCDRGPRELNGELEQLTHELMQDDCNATQRTNYGGWHYAFDLFKLDRPVVDDFCRQMKQHVQAYLNHFRPDDRRKKDSFKLQGWLNVNWAGNSNVLHCHPGAFLSGVYYLKVPDDMKGGEIVFRDPRGPASAFPSRSMHPIPDWGFQWCRAALREVEKARPIDLPEVTSRRFRTC